MTIASKLVAPMLSARRLGRALSRAIAKTEKENGRSIGAAVGGASRGGVESYVDVSTPTQADIDRTKELWPVLEAAMRESERLGPSVIPDDAEWSYREVPGEPVLACRTHDTAGRRVTCFATLTVSTGLNGVALAKRIATILG